MTRTSLRRSSSPLRKRRKTRKGQVPEAVLDGLWSKRVRERDEACRLMGQMLVMGHVCGVRPTQAAHIYSRVYRQIRHDLDNGLGLCAACHFFVHRNPVMAGRMYQEILGRKKLDTLWIKAQAVAKIDRHAVKAHLQARLKELQV